MTLSFEGKQMTDEAKVEGELLKSIADSFRAYGPIMENGMSMLNEVSIQLERFKVVIRPNESQHRGRPHCLIELRGKSATFDINGGSLLAGDLKPWNRTAEKVIAENSVKLMALWDKTRPDDQKLN